MTRSILIALAFLFPVAALAADGVKPPALVDIMTPTAEAKAAEIAAAMPVAVAAPIPPIDPAKFPVLAKIKEQSGDANYDYLGQRFGLDLWLISGPGVMQIIYTLPNNQGAIIGGSLIDAEGKELSGTLQQEFIAKNPERAEAIITAVKSKNDGPAAAEAQTASSSPTQKIWSLLEASGHVGFGKEGGVPVLYAVMDPFQQASRDLWSKIYPMAEQNKIRVNVIPLATSKVDDVNIIAQLLGEEEQQDSWRKLIAGEKLGAPKVKEPQGVLMLKNNLELMEALQSRDVPLLLYKDAASGKARIVKGMPKDWPAFEKELGFTP
jgi:hypothetical protein